MPPRQPASGHAVQSRPRLQKVFCLKPIHILLLMGVATLWSGSFLFTRMAAPDFGPIALSATRSAIAALVLMPLVLLTRRRAEFIDNLPKLVIIGLISTALPFTLITISTQYTSAGFASILNALTPLFSALLAWAWLKERLSGAALLGIGLGFSGVTVMMFDRDTIETDLPLLPILAGIGATFFYGLTGNFTRRYLRNVSALTISSGSQLFAALFLMVPAFFYWPEQALTTQDWLLAAVLGIFCTGLALLLFFHLLSQVGVARAVVATYLVPVLAMLWGHLVLEELVTPQMLGGAILILTGIGLTTRT